MQARVDRLGSSLIPEYQRNLANDDPSKISFRFQLIDNPKFHDALTLPNGIILIPRQIVEKLQDDSQLATVIADNMATALEKQSYRIAPAYNTTNMATGAAVIGGAFVPGLGWAGMIAKSVSDASIETDLMQQSGRVSLDLLHDAGYDLRQAPVAWWLLAAKPSKSLAETKIPPRAINLYRAIGLIWKNRLETVIPANGPTTSSRIN
jgi:predicted Zn-dependent protease